MGRTCWPGLSMGQGHAACRFCGNLLHVIIGLPRRNLAGYYGRRIDLFLMRITEFFQVLPPILLPWFSSRSFLQLYYGRRLHRGRKLDQHRPATRASFLKIKEMDFVRAARATGADELPDHVAHYSPQCLSTPHRHHHPDDRLRRSSSKRP